MNEFEHKGINYKKAEISDSSVVITKEEIDKLKSQLDLDGACLKNAYITAKITHSKCVEGFVFCMVANGDKVDDKVIRHCWNMKDGNHFDLTKDFIWTSLPGKAKDFFYFIIGEYEYSDYDYKLNNGKIAFISDVETISKEIDEIWQNELNNSKDGK